MSLLGNIKSLHSVKFRFTFTHVYIHAPQNLKTKPTIICFRFTIPFIYISISKLKLKPAKMECNYFFFIESIVQKYAEDNFNGYVSMIWEDLCREYVSGTIIDGIPYKIAHRWHGTIIKDEDNKELKKVELDVVAESFDGKHILIGECKWTGKEDASREIHRLQTIAPKLPFGGLLIPRLAENIILFRIRRLPLNTDSCRN